MPKMYFIEELDEYLREKSLIYTVRKYLYERPDCVVFIEDVGGCQRTLIRENVRKWDLLPYAAQSGLGTVEKWWDKILEINRDYNGPLYLYKIELIRRLG